MEENLKKQLWELLEPLILKQKMELVDLEWRRERIGWVLRLYIDKPGGVTIKDCVKISEIAGKFLDKKNLIHHSYNLEVSSPGIERPLKSKEHFERFVGEKAKITLKEPLSGRRNFTGIILGVKGETLQLLVDEEVREFSLEKIKKAILQPEITF